MNEKHRMIQIMMAANKGDTSEIIPPMTEEEKVTYDSYCEELKKLRAVNPKTCLVPADDWDYSDEEEETLYGDDDINEWLNE